MGSKPLVFMRDEGGLYLYLVAPSLSTHAIAAACESGKRTSFILHEVKVQTDSCGFCTIVGIDLGSQ